MSVDEAIHFDPNVRALVQGHRNRTGIAIPQKAEVGIIHEANIEHARRIGRRPVDGRAQVPGLRHVSPAGGDQSCGHLSSRHKHNIYAEEAVKHVVSPARVNLQIL